MEKTIALKLAELQTEAAELRADVSMIKHFVGEIVRSNGEMNHQLGMLLAIVIEYAESQQLQQQQKQQQQKPTKSSPPDIIAVVSSSESSDDDDDEDDSDIVDEPTDEEPEAAAIETVRCEEQQQPPSVCETEQPAAKVVEEDKDKNQDEGDANGFMSKLAALLRRLFPRAERYDPEDPRILLALSDMGFGDEERIRTALKTSHGVVGRAVDTLLASPKPPVAAAIASDK